MPYSGMLWVVVGPLSVKTIVAGNPPKPAGAKLTWTVHVAPARTPTPVQPSVPFTYAVGLAPPKATPLTVTVPVVLLCSVTACAVDVAAGATPPKLRCDGVTNTLPPKENERMTLPEGTKTWPPA